MFRQFIQMDILKLFKACKLSKEANKLDVVDINDALLFIQSIAEYIESNLE